MRSKRLSHFFGFLRELANDSRFAGSPLNVRLSRFVISRARTRRTMRAREKNLRDSFSPASLDSFGSRARARAIFFPRVHTHRDETPSKRKRGEKRRLSSFSKEIVRNARMHLMRARRPFMRTRKTRAHPSTRPFLPRRTSVTSSNTETHHHRRHRA